MITLKYKISQPLQKLKMQNYKSNKYIFNNLKVAINNNKSDNFHRQNWKYLREADKLIWI